ncbi:hypothetical protein STEG23_014659 [Scotinomys teguina]
MDSPMVVAHGVKKANKRTELSSSCFFSIVFDAMILHILKRLFQTMSICFGYHSLIKCKRRLIGIGRGDKNGEQRR